MSRRQTLFGWLSVLAASALFCVGVSAPTPSAGQPPRPEADAEPIDPETPLPADPILYVGWDGEEAHREVWERTAAYQALYDTGLMTAIERMFAEVMPEDEGGQAELIRALSETLQANGVSLAVALPEGEDAPPLPWGVAVLHGAAEQEPAIAEAVRGLIENQPTIEIDTADQRERTVTTLRTSQFPPAELAWWVEGEHLVVAAGIGAVNRALAVADGDSDDITDSRLWRAYREAPRKTVAALGWFDVERALKAAGPFPVPTRDGRQVTVGQIAEAIGVDGLKAIVFRSGFDGRATWSEARTETDGELAGLMALGDQAPITLDDLPPLPARLGGFAAGSLDLAAAYETVMEAAGEIVSLGTPEAQRQFRENVERLPDTLGLDPAADLLEPLGNVVCVYSDEGQGPLGLGLTVVVSVDDAETLRETIDGLLDAAARQFAPKQFNVRRVEMQDYEVVTLEIVGGFANPSFVVTDDWFAVAIVPQSIETFLLRVDDELPAWKPEGEFAAALKTVPREFTSLVVSDPRATYRFLAGLAPVVLPIARAALAQQRGVEPPFEVPVADLPPAEIVAQGLFPNVTVGYRDGDTFVRTSRTSLPGLLGGDSAAATTAVAAVGVALLLPAVQQARTAARNAQSKNNLKQLGLALHNYHDTFNHLPRGTVVNPNAKPEERLSWIVSVLPFLEQKAIYDRFQERRAWDDRANANLAKTRLPVLMNPAVTVEEREDGAAPTHYAGFAGLGEKGPTLPITDPKAGLFAYDRTTRFTDVTDGLSNTAAIGEVTGASAGSWAKGGPSTIRPLTKQPYVNGPDGFGGPYTGGFNVLMSDGAVRFVSKDVDPKVMEAMVTIRGGEAVVLP